MSTATVTRGPVSRGKLVEMYLALLSCRDQETTEHCRRVARYALRLAAEVSKAGIQGGRDLDRRPLGEIELGALLHDVGKLHVSADIIQKRGPLDGAETYRMREHVLIGAQIVAAWQQLAPARATVLCHHERWDGKGYPYGLTKLSIPLCARVFAVCDAYDAMTSDRPYRAAGTYAAAREAICNAGGTQFDPNVVREWLQIAEHEWTALR